MSSCMVVYLPTFSIEMLSGLFVNFSVRPSSMAMRKMPKERSLRLRGKSTSCWMTRLSESSRNETAHRFVHGGPFFYVLRQRHRSFCYPFSLCACYLESFPQSQNQAFHRLFSFCPSFQHRVSAKTLQKNRKKARSFCIDGL